MVKVRNNFHNIDIPIQPLRRSAVILIDLAITSCLGIRIGLATIRFRTRYIDPTDGGLGFD